MLLDQLKNDRVQYWLRPKPFGQSPCVLSCSSNQAVFLPTTVRCSFHKMSQHLADIPVTKTVAYHRPWQSNYLGLVWWTGQGLNPVWSDSGILYKGPPPIGLHHFCLWLYWLLTTVPVEGLLSVLWMGMVLRSGWPLSHPMGSLFNESVSCMTYGLRPVCHPTPSPHSRKWGCQRLIKCNFFLFLQPDISSSTLSSVLKEFCCSICV